MPRLRLEAVLEHKGKERTERVVANGRDIRAYESQFEESFLTQTSYEQLTKIAFVALRRAGRFDGTYEDFDAQCVDLEEFYESELDPVDPTPKAAGDDSS
jgi:hypothetical protein